ncbi:MAG: hypothetical protein HY541_02445 [Deltaproteobacteria bacterium]|nr:hypothetical protein [Deltaproteobacteria bacterium]
MPKIVPLLVAVCLFFSAHPVFSREREGFALSFDAFSTVGFKSDRFDVYFDIPATDLTNAGVGTRIGIEGVQKYGFGVKFLAGYQRVFYSNVGIGQIKKNYFTTDLLFTWHVPKTVKKWDWYLMAGPSFLASSSGVQGYLATGGGLSRFIGHRWSFKVEPSVVTDFSGVWSKLAAGVNYHF